VQCRKTFLFYRFFPSVISAFILQSICKKGICKKYLGRTGQFKRTFAFFFCIQENSPTQRGGEKLLRTAYSFSVIAGSGELKIMSKTICRTSLRGKK